MDEHEFRQMLERFPIVRKKNHCRVEWNSIYDEDAKKPHNTVNLSENNEAFIKPEESLRIAMEKFCKQFFSSTTECNKVYAEFEKAENDFLSSLCLEDIDDICAQFVNK